MTLQLGNETLGVQRGIRSGAGVEQPIEDHHCGLLPNDLATQQLDHFIQTVVFHGIEGTDELNLVVDLVLVEEAQRRQELKQAFMGFGQ